MHSRGAIVKVLEVPKVIDKKSEKGEKNEKCGRATFY